MFRIFMLVAPLLLGLVPLPAHAQKPVLTTLHRFTDGKYGQHPLSTLTLASDGNFYGTTVDGGLSDGNGNSNGTVFQMTPAGKLTTLWRFNGRNGRAPAGSLLEGKDGALYGTTQSGGPEGITDQGTVFRITKAGRLSTLHVFHGQDGSAPSGALTQSTLGPLYGTTLFGGASGNGTVFVITPAGRFLSLHSFQSSEGRLPYAGVRVSADGRLYGVAAQGGAKGFGTVYRLSTNGTGFTVLHTFTGDGGAFPSSRLTGGPFGDFYGLTAEGGIGNAGIAYSISLSGTFTVLHKFSADGHGAAPSAELALSGADRLLYGTTSAGGTNNKGTVFVMNADGQVTTLYKFHTDFDGADPLGVVVFGPDGLLYGTTETGGANGSGTIFSLSVPAAN